MIELTMKRGKVQIGFDFFAAAGLCMYYRTSRIPLMIFAACLLHELGHLIVMRVSGEHLKIIKFYGGGIRITPEKNPSAAVLMAGITANIIAGAVFWALYSSSAGNASPPDSRMMLYFSAANFAVGGFNLLPVYSTDGAAVLKIRLTKMCSKNSRKKINPEKTSRIISRIFTVLLLLIAILAYHYKKADIVTLISAGYIFILSLM